MKLPLASIPKTKIGCCPHGLPAGACPICSGMGGGGGGSKRTDKASGEMSWDECFAVGQMLKAQKLAQQQKNLAMQGQGNVNLPTRLENMALKIVAFSEKMGEFVQKVQSGSLPKIISKPLVLALKIALPIINLIKNVPIIVQNTINFIKEKFVDISDKLNAVFGELKNSIEKKISERFKDLKKRAKSFFGIFEPTEIDDDEEKKIEESKRLFEMKTAFQSIKEKLFTSTKKEIKDDNS